MPQNFCEITTLDLSNVVPVKSTVEILQNLVAFSEYMNFINPESHLYVRNVEELVKRGGGTFYGQFRGFSQSNFMARKRNILCLLPAIKVCKKNDLCR